MSNLCEQNCEHQSGDFLNQEKISQYLTELQESWKQDEHRSVEFDFKFKNFHETMSFVNAVAWIANQQDHHPDLEVGYNHCLVRFSTHSVGGLSVNDFICAARVEKLLS